MNEVRRRRILEQLNQFFFAPSDHYGDYSSQNRKLHVLDREATDLGEGVTRRTVVSPTSGPLTSTLNVSLLTIPPGAILSTQACQGVEFYYVLQGTCTISTTSSSSSSSDKNNNNPSNELIKGEIMVLEPWTKRSISNSAYTETWVLRATDGGDLAESYDATDVASMKANKESTASKLLSSGLKQMESLIGSYKQTGGSSKETGM